MRADVIHEHPVMRHEYERALEFQQKFFQPLYGVEIQMVGGFVQQQHVRACGENLGQFGPFAPAAGKLFQRQSPFCLLETEAGEYGLGFLLGIVAVARFQIVLTGHEAGQGGFVAAAVGLFPFRPEIAPVGQRALNPGQERRVQRVLVKNLFHIANPAAARYDDSARVRLGRARHDPDERGFAAAVGAADAQTHAVQHVEGKVGKDILSAIGFTYILECNVHGGD